MPRRARDEEPGAVYHVTIRGNGGCAIVRDDIDRLHLLGDLATCVRMFGWHVLAYCLMDNHLHLVVVTPEPNLGRGMHRFLSRYAQRFNNRHDRNGHLFGERYHAERINGDAHLVEGCVYVVLNPVRAGICADPADWWWSSYRETAGLAEPSDWLSPDLLLTVAAPGAADARAAYRLLVGDVLSRGRPTSPEARRLAGRTPGGQAP